MLRLPSAYPVSWGPLDRCFTRICFANGAIASIAEALLCDSLYTCPFVLTRDDVEHLLTACALDTVVLNRIYRIVPSGSALSGRLGYQWFHSVSCVVWPV